MKRTLSPPSEIIAEAAFVPPNLLVTLRRQLVYTVLHVKHRRKSVRDERHYAATLA